MTFYKGFRMARRSDHSREELREMALQAGLDIVRAEGAQALTTREVARRIGYSPGTLYVIFKNIDDLKFQLNARTLGLLRRQLAETLTAAGDPKEKLQRMGMIYLDFALGSPNLWRLMFEHQLPGGEPMPEVVTQQTDALLAIVAEVFAEIVPADSNMSVANVAAAFWSALHGITHLVITEKLALAHVDSAHKVLDTQMRAFLAGVTSLVSDSKS
jgi:AcrR family transcriptional regulator